MIEFWRIGVPACRTPFRARSDCERFTFSWGFSCSLLCFVSLLCISICRIRTRACGRHNQNTAHNAWTSAREGVFFRMMFASCTDFPKDIKLISGTLIFLEKGLNRVRTALFIINECRFDAQAWATAAACNLPNTEPQCQRFHIWAGK